MIRPIPCLCGIFTVTLLTGPLLRAVPANPELTEMAQPNGHRIKVQLRGDEWFSWHEDDKGYAVVKDPKDQFWKYARPLQDKAEFEALPGAVVGPTNPSDLRIRKGWLPPLEILRNHIGKSRAGRPDESAPDQNASTAESGSEPSPLTEQPPPQPIPIAGTKTIRNVVILAAFSDHWDAGANTVLTTKGRTNLTEYQNLFNQVGHTSDGAVGSVKDYYKEVSYGKLTIDSVVSPWVALPQNQAYYGAGNPDANARKMVSDAITAANNAGFDFSQGDSDGDGWIDCLTIIHSGHGQEISGNSSDCIWSHQWTMSSTMTVDGVRMLTYHTSPALRGSDGTSATASTGIIRIGVICHEMGHFFGLPDLYDYAGTYSSASVGNWCIMSGGSWGGNLGHRPTHFSAWCKHSLGFVMPKLTHSAESLMLPDVTTSDTIHMIRDGTSENEYYLVENRNQTGFDASTPGKGVMIWHIDERSGNNDSATWPHPLVKMEDADGDQVANEPASAWYGGNAGMLPGGFRDQTGNTNTNAMRYQSGSYFTRSDSTADHTHIRLGNFSTTGSNMTASLSSLVPTLFAKTVDTSNFTVSWAATSNATQYEIQEGQPSTATSYVEGFETAADVHDNWSLSACQRSTDGARTGMASVLLSQYHDNQWWASAQSMTTRGSYQITSNTSVQFHYKSGLSSGLGRFRFLASNDNGTTWRPLWNHTGGLINQWTAVNLGVSELTAAGFSVSDQLMFRFDMNTESLSGLTSYPSYGWAIDDFSVTDTAYPSHINWTTLSDSVATNAYEITGKSDGIYAYRVRGNTNSVWQRYSPAATVTVNGSASSPAEIDISRDGSAVANGDHDNVQESNTGIGTPLTYSIANQGGMDLILNQVVKSAENNCTVTIDSQPVSPVACYGMTSLVVTVTPMSDGIWNFHLSLPNNDSDESPYSWTVAGTSVSQYTVTLDPQGGSGGSGSVTATLGMAMPGADPPTRTGYTFGGYYSGAGGTGTAYYSSSMTSTNLWDIGGHTTLYAKWTANSYTITFQPNGGTDPDPASKPVVYGSTYGTLATVSRAGYTFTGWYTHASEGSLVTGTTTVTDASDHTLHAHWTANLYTVSFDTNGGDPPSRTGQSVTFGSAYGALATATRTGFTFNGWFTAASGGSLVSDATIVATPSDHTLHAQWTREIYTVSYNGNGNTHGTAPFDSSAYNHNDTVSALDRGSLAKTGYSFAGWNTAPDGGGTGYAVGESFAITGNMTLHAQWQPPLPVIHEPFADADTILAGNTAGTGLTGPWVDATNRFTVSGNSLTYGSLATSGHHGSINNSLATCSADIDTAPMARSGLLENGATLWFSMLLQTPSINNGSADTGFAIGSGKVGSGNGIPMAAGEQGIGFSITGGTLAATSWNPSKSTGGGVTIPANAVQLIVGRIIWGESNDIMELYLPDTNLALGNPVSSLGTNLNQSGFGCLSFGMRSNNSFGFDEIRLGATYESVIGLGAADSVYRFDITGFSSSVIVGEAINGITITAKTAGNLTASSFNGSVTYSGSAGMEGRSADFTDGVLADIVIAPAITGTDRTFITTDDSGHSGIATFTVRSRYSGWSSGRFLREFSDADPGSNPDGDPLTNLQEFAFGLDPTSPVLNLLRYVPGGDLTASGLPIMQDRDGDPLTHEFDAVFARRKDSVMAGLVYSVEFSADLKTWTASSEGLQVVAGAAGSGDYEAVRVPFPDEVVVDPEGTAVPRFFRISVR